VEKARRLRPDLMFLDVQMPELDGVGVVTELGAELPFTAFVTAYDHHAVRAFEADALDYLLKPFSDERFEATMARIRARMRERRASQAAASPLTRLIIKSAGVARLLRTEDIEWIEATGVYVTIHHDKGQSLYRAGLTQLESCLDPRQFIRVHRSALVNLERIERMEPLSHGEFELLLKGGGRARLSRTYRAAFEQRLGQSL
jgi:two-component system, LytTR family, response regulator